MDEGTWVTINGNHVLIKDGQSPMDAFIRQKGGKVKELQDKLENDIKKLNYNEKY